TKKDGEEKVA
nr:RecName: Full=Serine proteinase inhibitor [Halocynthia roretzi]